MFGLQDDSAIISSTRFQRQKASLLCLIGGIDLEYHNVADLVKHYQKFHSNPSLALINLIIRRGLTVVLNKDGLVGVRSFLTELQQKIEIDMKFLDKCESAFRQEEFTEIVITEQAFREKFLGHIQECFVCVPKSSSKGSSPAPSGSQCPSTFDEDGDFSYEFVLDKKLMNESFSDSD